jgi:hypothetical protein
LPWPLPDSSFRRFRLLNSYAAAKKCMVSLFSATSICD